jgi:hypothetical protein
MPLWKARLGGMQMWGPRKSGMQVWGVRLGLMPLWKARWGGMQVWGPRKSVYEAPLHASPTQPGFARSSWLLSDGTPSR